MISLNRTDKSVLSQWWWTVDRWSVVAVVCLIVIGAVLSLAASPAIAMKYEYPVFHYVNRTLLYLAPSTLLLFSASLLTPVQVRRLAAVVFLISIVLMILTLFIGPEINGARRWIRIGSFSLQPSEFVKPSFVVLCAWLFAEKNRNSRTPGNLVGTLLLALVACLLFYQPDFGQILLLAAVWATMFSMAGMPSVWIAGLGTATGLGLVAAYSYLPHVASRVDRFFDPTRGDTYQTDKALEAFRAGGLLGRGPGEGTIKNFIPDAHTDFIFAVTAEEFGLIACLVIVGIFCFVVARSFARAMSVDDHFIQLASAGLVTLFGLQAFVNMGVSLNLLPAKGMTLPFISYGGSSSLAMALGVGMLLALTRRWTINSLTVEVTA